MSKKNRTSRWRRSKKQNPIIARTESNPTLRDESEHAGGTTAELHEEPSSVGPAERDPGLDANQQIEPNSPIDQEPPYLPPRSIGNHLLWKRRREKWMPVITVAVSVVGLILIGAQVFIYDQQRRIMNNQVSVSERNVRISERAYVGVASIKADLRQGEIVIMLENLGRLPANTIQMTANAYLVGTKLDGYDNVFRAGEVKLFPGSFQMPVVIKTRKYSMEEIQTINDKKKFLYLAGVIRYEDGFGFLDTTPFAFEYKPPPNENWSPVSTPVAQLRETLEKMSFTLSVDPLFTVTPSPAISPSLIPTDKPSPLASVTATPKTMLSHVFKVTSNTSSCGCSCAIVCNERCDYECNGCGLVEGAEAAKRCCEAAREATGVLEPCGN